MARLFIYVCIEEGRLVSETLVVASFGGWGKVGKKNWFVCFSLSALNLCMLLEVGHKRTSFVLSKFLCIQHQLSLFKIYMTYTEGRPVK